METKEIHLGIILVGSKNMIKKILIFNFLLSVLIVSGCGQYGDLYLQNNQNEQNSEINQTK